MKAPLNHRIEMMVFPTLEYLFSAFAGVVARVVVEPGRDIESLRGRMSPSGMVSEGGRQAPCRACRDIEGLFESLLAESFA